MDVSVNPLMPRGNKRKGRMYLNKTAAKGCHQVLQG